MNKRKWIHYIKEIGFFLIHGFYRLIYCSCNIVRVKDKTIFVNCFDGKGYGDNPKYIVENLLKRDSEYRIYWLYKGGKEQAPVKQITYVRPMSMKAVYAQSVSKFWISTVRMPFYSIKRQEQIYIHTWHAGLALKKVERECENALSSRYIRTAKHDAKMIDYYISSNKDNTRLYQDFFWYAGGKILEIGSPRNDVFFHTSQEERTRIKQNYGIGNDNVITYAPTFRKDGSFAAYSVDFHSLLQVVMEKFGGRWKVLVRLHPRLSEISDKFVKFDTNIINGSHISDSQEVLMMTDILITDYSSISTDFLLTDKPIFIFATDMEEYKKDRDFHIGVEELPFDIARTNGELKNNITGFDEKRYYERINAFKSKYSFFDKGTASETISELIIKVEKDKSRVI